MAVNLNRGLQMEKFRQERYMTDVELVSEDVSLPCHKLVLSLHSHYFKTLFSSSGFAESGQEQIPMSHISPSLLELIVKFIYTGNITVTRETAVDILEVVTCLQIEDKEDNLVQVVSKVLINCAKSSTKFQELFYIWNVSVTYDLHDVLEIVLSEVDNKLETFLSDPEDLVWLSYLGWEELRQILVREELCVQSETVLLQFVLNWAKDKVDSDEDFSRLNDLLKNIRQESIDKKMMRRALKENFEAFYDPSRHNTSMSSSKDLPRSCRLCNYVIQYKLAKTQIRNIEDFIDSGQKSLFMSFNLFDPTIQSSLKTMTNMSSMVGTAAGHYGRPVTSGSAMVRWRHFILVVGGVTDGQRGDKNIPRPDILVYNALKRCWVTSLKQFVRINHGFRLHDAVQLDSSLYLIILPTSLETVTHVNMPSVDKINLDTACELYKLDRMSVAKIPEELWFRDSASVGADAKIYFVAEGVAWYVDCLTWEWHKLPPPIGHIGGGRPVLAWCPPLVYLVSARMEDSTNVLEALDTHTRQWRRFPNLDTRMTVLDLFCHNGLLFLVGWQPARNNFVMTVDRDSGETRVVLEGIQGVWSRGLVVKGPYFNELVNSS